MIWLRKLLGLCAHKWKIIDHRLLVNNAGDIPHGTKYILQCEHCGIIRVQKV